MTNTNLVPVRRAIISVFDKTGLVPLVKGLRQLNVDILSTGGTFKVLQKEGVEVTEVSAYTGFPEMMDGRVKTLHPKIHGGLLHLRDNEEHVKQAKAHEIKAIDLVVVNLYPFEATVAKKDVTLEEAIENIDIGGPAMLRSGAKNYRFVAVVVDPADYDGVLKEMEENEGCLSEATRKRLALKAFVMTSKYDAHIEAYLEKQGFKQESEPKPAQSSEEAFPLE
jgi:phosphoribosylaminoimidazolecarboxamide formyltransferase / IMP cyclohydrolase